MSSYPIKLNIGLLLCLNSYIGPSLHQWQSILIFMCSRDQNIKAKEGLNP